MPRLWPLVTAAWSANPGRALAALTSVALGVGGVLTVTVFHETAHRAISDQVVSQWLGSAHVSVHPPGAHWGQLDATLAEEFKVLSNVEHVTARLHRRLHFRSPRSDVRSFLTHTVEVDAVGINPATERPFRVFPSLSGRALTPEDRGAVVTERELVKVRGLDVGDSMTLSIHEGGPQHTFRIVGLFDSQRIAEFQHPVVYLPLADLRAMEGEPNAASVIDIQLADASLPAIEQAKKAVTAVLQRKHPRSGMRVETAAARQTLLGEADRITRLLIILVALITMLTSFFIILTTQSVSLAQRRPQLGMLRCVGMTRGQLASLMFAELAPIGLLGTILGIGGGLLAVALAGYLGREMFLRMYISSWGIVLSIACGLATTVLGALFLIFQTARLAPLEAVNTQAKAPRLSWVMAATAGGVGLLVLHALMVALADRARWLSSPFAITGVLSLYLGYALIAPGLVVWLGRPIAGLMGRLLGLRASLAAGPIEQAPWRSTGACWVLMVGLSLIVYVAVRAEGVLDIWNFPSQLPEAFVWSPNYVPGRMIDEVRKMPGVGRLSTTADVDCEVEKTGKASSLFGTSVVEKFLRSLSRPVYVAAEPQEIMSMIKVAFIEGDPKEGIEKIERGGYVFIPPQTSKSKDLHLGDKVTVTIKGQSATFEVAGVIQSPALDIAVTAFQAESYLQFAAATAILGTRKDLKAKFGLDVVAMFMFEVELSPVDLPEGFRFSDWPEVGDEQAVAKAALAWVNSLPEESASLGRVVPEIRSWLEAGAATTLSHEARTELRRFAQALFWIGGALENKNASPVEAWEAFRERLVLTRVAYALDRPDAIMGSLRRLKQQIDVTMRRAIAVVTWLPSFLLALAAVGIGNLMMVSVHQRTRELAILRAVGAERKQIVRMVLAEALTLGLLGSAIGVALGLHEAYSVNQITAALMDVSLRFLVPMGTVAAAVGLTVLVSVLAGWIPARRAASQSVAAALQTI